MELKSKGINHKSKYDIGDILIQNINGNDIEYIIYSISINIRTKRFADMISYKEIDIEYHLYREDDSRTAFAMSVDEDYIKENFNKLK